MPTSTDVLNPQLYTRLLDAFGLVRITHAGEAMVARVVRDGSPNGHRLEIEVWGESYLVQCPFCRVEGFHLAVNHSYGQRDEFGRPMLFVAKCFARNCLTLAGNRRELAAMLSADDGRLETAPLCEGDDPSQAGRPVALPGKLTRLDRLYDGHVARRQIRRLDLDADRVGRYYGVGYCAESAVQFARDRIIIPITMRGALQGWQALAVEDRDPLKFRHVLAPRFLSAPGMAAGKLVYNLDTARAYATGILVPTPVDVWRFGPMALCPVGDRWTEDHGRQIATVFRRTSLVFVADKDTLSRTPAERLIYRLGCAMAAGFRVVTLPETARRAPLDRATLRKLVAEDAANQGLGVRYERDIDT